jgi:hypothetical protein
MDDDAAGRARVEADDESGRHWGWAVVVLAVIFGPPLFLLSCVVPK